VPQCRAHLHVPQLPKFIKYQVVENLWDCQDFKVGTVGGDGPGPIHYTLPSPPPTSRLSIAVSVFKIQLYVCDLCVLAKIVSS
jgi:hypothetical protein